MNKIKKVYAREVIDSRSNPTVEAEITLKNDIVARAIVPSGASTGKYEALELRDNDSNRFSGKGVLKAINNVNSSINDVLINKDINDLINIDETLIKLDGTENKSNLGANATLAVSMACYQAKAKASKTPLFKVLGNQKCYNTPTPMLNVINGGAHSNNNIDIQEFMIVPVNFTSFKEKIRASIEVYQALKTLLKENGLSTSVGDEGGFAPMLSSHEEVLDYLIKAINKAGYKENKDFMIALDAAASEWASDEKGIYVLPKCNAKYTSNQLIDYWEKLCEKYPILSIEDGLGEDDLEGWVELTKRLGNKIMLVGDDLFVTNQGKLKEGINKKIANSILIKPNQIGTILETLNTIDMAKNANYNVVISHRSGESEDTFISHLSVGVNAPFIKTGAPCRSERVAKYNELLRIEEQI